MYVGRIVAVGKNPSGDNAVLYRVSSRSFPSRRAVESDGRIAIIPREGHEADLLKSPYISYNCLRVAGEWAIAANGSHTDPIAEKVAAGVPLRDALASVLMALDYEKDAYSTPRIAAAVPLRGEQGWLAIVRADSLVVKAVPLESGVARYVATYEADDVRDTQTAPLEVKTAPEAASAIVGGPGFDQLEKPITSAAALAGESDFALATHVV